MGRKVAPGRSVFQDSKFCGLVAAVALALVPASPVHAATVTVNNNFFDPDVVSAQPGDMVVWTWAGGATHSVTSDDGESFDSGQMSSGKYGHRFYAVGHFAYHCVVHPSMTGTVVVPGITGRVLADADATNTVTGPDEGLAYVPVELHDALSYSADPTGSAPYAGTVTDAAGRYTFDNDPRPEGGYATVHVPQQAGFTGSGDVIAVRHDFSSIVEDVDVLFEGIGAVAGAVWDDVNGNGTHDVLETGMGGISVSLGGKRSTTTAGDGSYSFAEAIPGAGTVSVTAPGNFHIVGAALRPIDLQAPDYTADDQDFFVQQLGSISGSVREDLNGSGTFDSGEGGVGGVSIGLDMNSDEVPDTTATTDADGEYSFANLAPRKYRVILNLPVGHENTGSAAIDANVTPGQDSALPHFHIRRPPPVAGPATPSPEPDVAPVALGPQPTEGDDVLNGTTIGDVIFGLAGHDAIFGFAGDDLLNGGDGDDKLTGGIGRDTLKGGPGNDNLLGGAGNDDLSGGPGRDKLYGGKGNDKLTGNRGKDLLVGGPGNDTINSRDGVAELVKCGPGKDKVKRDKTDKLSGCESRIR